GVGTVLRLTWAIVAPVLGCVNERKNRRERFDKLGVRSANAGVAQLVEQLIRNQQVTRSSRVAGSIRLRARVTTRATAQFRRSLGEGESPAPAFARDEHVCELRLASQWC